MGRTSARVARCAILLAFPYGAFLAPVPPQALYAAKRPEYRQCAGPLCVAGLEWRDDYRGFAYTGYHLEGRFENNSATRIAAVVLSFDLMSGTAVIGNTLATVEQIGAGQTWLFEAPMVRPAGNRLISGARPARIQFQTPDGRLVRSEIDFAQVCNRNLGKRFCQ
jgi:hypothetical protein